MPDPPPTDPSASPIPPPPAAADGPAEAETGSPALTAEEQMALYEEALKDTDWGHQPC